MPQTIDEESIPPDKVVPIGTSLLNLKLIESFKSSRISSEAVLKVPS